MAANLVSLVLLALVVAQGQANTLREVTLPDETVAFISHPFYSRTITISQWWFEKLLSCDVVYPTGVNYQAYPNNNLPDKELHYSTGVQPFNGCSVTFSHSDRIQGFSGAYELEALVQHEDETMTLTRQRFYVSIRVSETGVPSQAEVRTVDNDN